MKKKEKFTDFKLIDGRTAVVFIGTGLDLITAQLNSMGRPQLLVLYLVLSVTEIDSIPLTEEVFNEMYIGDANMLMECVATMISPLKKQT